jgi:hypothetical protein
VKRIYRPYWEWEDFQHGMWSAAKIDDASLARVIEFTGDAELYGSYMLRVIKEWPKSCEHNLTEKSMNRAAWLGHAAACMAIGAPEHVTRKAWGFLSQEQQDAANAKAYAAIMEWERAQEDSQLYLFVEA